MRAAGEGRRCSSLEHHARRSRLPLLPLLLPLRLRLRLRGGTVVAVAAAAACGGGDGGDGERGERGLGIGRVGVERPAGLAQHAA